MRYTVKATPETLAILNSRYVNSLLLNFKQAVSRLPPLPSLLKAILMGIHILQTAFLHRLLRVCGEMGGAVSGER